MRLRDELDLEALAADLRGVVARHGAARARLAVAAGASRDGGWPGGSPRGRCRLAVGVCRAFALQVARRHADCPRSERRDVSTASAQLTFGVIVTPSPRSARCSPRAGPRNPIGWLLCAARCARAVRLADGCVRATRLRAARVGRAAGRGCCGLGELVVCGSALLDRSSPRCCCCSRRPAASSRGWRESAVRGRCSRRSCASVAGDGVRRQGRSTTSSSVDNPLGARAGGRRCSTR